MILTIHVKPRARQNALEAILDATTAKVSVTAAPERGAANHAVLALLADALDLPPSALRLVRGATTRLKHIESPKDFSHTSTGPRIRPGM